MDEDIKKPHWIIMGPKESWETALNQGGIWGLKKILYPEWKAMEQGDVIFLYATSPIAGVIGVGRFDTRFIQDKPMWPDEMSENRVIYPLRFQFHVDYVLEQNRWERDRVKVPLTIQEMRRGVNLLRGRTVDQLYEAIADKFKYTISPPTDKTDILPAKGLETPEVPIDHGKIQELVFEIGRLNRFISEKEYPMEDERLDVVWRRVEKSVPTYVFEIQIGGDVYHALGKLKHAFDLWNSNIFLVAPEDELERAEHLLNGTFHEIKDKIKKISTRKTSDLYQQKRKWIDMEKEVGLL